MTYTTLSQDVVPATEVEQATSALSALPADSALREFFERQLAAVTRGASVSVLEEDRELNPNDVAALLQVSRPYIMKHIRSGSLPAHTVGTHFRIKQSDALEFLNRRDRASKFVAEVLAAPRKRYNVELSDAAMDELDKL